MLLDMAPCMLFVWSDVWREERPITLCESYYLPISLDLSFHGKTCAPEISPCQWGTALHKTTKALRVPVLKFEISFELFWLNRNME